MTSRTFALRLIPALLIVAALTAGCTHVKYRVHRTAQSVQDAKQWSYYHSPHTGEIVPKHPHAACEAHLELPQYGFQQTCWRPWPGDGPGCPEVIEQLDEGKPHSIGEHEQPQSYYEVPEPATSLEENWLPKVILGEDDSRSAVNQQDEPLSPSGQLDPATDFDDGWLPKVFPNPMDDKSNSTHSADKDTEAEEAKTPSDQPAPAPPAEITTDEKVEKPTEPTEPRKPAPSVLDLLPTQSDKAESTVPMPNEVDTPLESEQESRRGTIFQLNKDLNIPAARPQTSQPAQPPLADDVDDVPFRRYFSERDSNASVPAKTGATPQAKPPASGESQRRHARRRGFLNQILTTE